MREKQKAKRYYGLLESQFRSYFDMAERRPGQTGENLPPSASRLDNVVYRLGFAMSRAEARQLVEPRTLHRQRPQGQHPQLPGEAGHGRLSARAEPQPRKIKANVEANAFRQPPKWLDYDAANMIAKVTAVPAREDIRPADRGAPSSSSSIQVIKPSIGKLNNARPPMAQILKEG